MLKLEDWLQYVALWTGLLERMLKQGNTCPYRFEFHKRQLLTERILLVVHTLAKRSALLLIA